MGDFRNLDVWKKSHALVLAIYQETKHFPPDERYGLTSQIRRAALSIPSNIAEGSGHRSDPQFSRYLRLAIASAAEVQYQIILAKDLGYLNMEGFTGLSDLTAEVKRMLTGLLATIRAGN